MADVPVSNVPYDPTAEQHAPQANGYLTPDQMEQNAPADLEEKDIEGVFGGKVRIRSLSAHQSAKVDSAGFKMKPSGNGVVVTISDAHLLKFQLGVINPDLSQDPNRVMRLYQQSGKSFRRVLDAIDEISGTSDDSLRDAEAAFQGSEET